MQVLILWGVSILNLVCVGLNLSGILGSHREAAKCRKETAHWVERTEYFMGACAYTHWLFWRREIADKAFSELTPEQQAEGIAGGFYLKDGTYGPRVKMAEAWEMLNP